MVTVPFTVVPATGVVTATVGGVVSPGFPVDPLGLGVPADPVALTAEPLPVMMSETVPPPAATVSVVLTVVVVVGVNRTVIA